MVRQPYPGLRAFDREESDLFFGREACVDAMLDRLGATRFLAVLGSSGSGKSSLVRTGMLDALEIGLLASAGSRWAVATMRPGGAPIANLARALQPISGGAGEGAAAMLESFLRRGPRSLVQWCADGHLAPRTNLLVLADQFEELFRYADYAGREEAEAFVALLMESAQAAEVPIYVALTMRSEFLGACSLMPGLAERINRGLYLTPRMTRGETREAITGPAGVCGFSIEPALVNRLLNDLAAFAPWEDDRGVDQLQSLARRADQLPLMQHVLNRLWLRASAEGGPVVLRVADYERLGGLGGAIDAHAAEVCAALPEGSAPLPERVFRGLVTGTTVATALRRPCRFAELLALCEAPRDEAAAVVETFRAHGCNFLMPPPEVELADDTIVDISHESLIRQWSSLSAWLEREVRAGDTWRRLSASAAAHARGEAELLAGLDLDNMLRWWERETPTEAWARRHGGGFAEARDFLGRSKAAEAARVEAERARVATERARERRQKRLWRGAAAVMFLLSSGAGFAAWRAWQGERALEAQNLALEQSRAEITVRNRDLERTQTDLARSNTDLAGTVRSLDTARREAEDAQWRAEAAAGQADAARQRAESALEAAGDVLGGVMGVLVQDRHFALLGAEDLLRELTEALGPHFARMQELGAGAELALTEAETLWFLGRLTSRVRSTEDALPLFERLHASLSARTAQVPPSDRELRDLARATALLAQTYRNLGDIERARAVLDGLTPLMPAADAPLAGLSANVLDGYAWYLAERQFMQPYTAATNWRLAVRERML
jgi:hypothetical protein